MRRLVNNANHKLQRPEARDGRTARRPFAGENRMPGVTG
jgi:hypothetical protein